MLTLRKVVGLGPREKAVWAGRLMSPHLLRCWFHMKPEYLGFISWLLPRLQLPTPPLKPEHPGLCNHSTSWPTSGFPGMGGVLEARWSMSLFLLKVSPERALPLWVQGHSLPELLFHHFLLCKVKTMGYPYQGNQEWWESWADVLPKRC